MRFQELRDVDGTMLAQGLHPAIAVVAANAMARAAVVSAVVSTPGCRILQAADVEHQVERATAAAVEQHSTSVEQKRARVKEAEEALMRATDAGLKASGGASAAAEDLARFDDLATRLSAAEETYEAAVRADAEATRSLAAALGELDRVLGQRHSASSSLEQARSTRDSRGVPDAVIHQAMNLQAALASAEAERHAAVQQADETSLMARAANHDAKLALGTAHNALRSGMALISSGAPDWGPGLPLPGLVTNYRDQLASAVSSTQAADNQAKSAQRAAQSHLEEEKRDLDALVAAGPPTLDPLATIEGWARSDYFTEGTAVFADDAFASFGPEEVAAFASALSARGCQVIYLTDDPDVLGWAIGLPDDTGRASTIPNARVRKPALVSD